MAPRYGRGAMTNSWNDIANADLVLVIGGNPAENHPCGFKWAIKAREKRGAKIICIDPRFNRTAAVSDVFLQIRPGSDLALMGGFINYVIQNKKYNEEYVKHFTNAAYIVKDTYSFDPETGLFSGYDPEKRKYDQSLWGYELDENGFAKKDMTLEHPRCVFQLLKKHYERYTPEVVESITGIPKEKFLEVAEMIAQTGAPNKTMTHLYALGWTHHSFGTQLIGSMAILQLLLGNIGMAGGGVNALRGHANVQGATDLACESRFLPGYLRPPRVDQQSLKDHIEQNVAKPLDVSMNFFSANYGKFFISLLKAWFGPNATPENDFGYHYLPKMEKLVSWDEIVDRMHKGKLEGFVSLGVNLINNTADSRKVIEGLKNLKWMVYIDTFETEMPAFWKYAEKPEDIKTEVLLLPSAIFAEKDSSFTNSARVIKWHWKALDPPGDAKDEFWIMANFFMKLRDLYKKEGGVYPDPIMNLTWNFRNPYHPTAEEILHEMNGYALEDLTDDKGNVIVKKGERIPGFGVLRDDGTTACGMWLYSGVFPQSGNRAKSVDTSDPSGLGIYPNYGFAWPANRRILYNRASADPSGKPWDPNRKLVWWNDVEMKWVGNDVPDIKPDLTPDYGPFIMLPEGRGRLFASALVDGPFPEHYEPYESPIKNPLHPKGEGKNPVVKVYKAEFEMLADPKDYPHVATTYRVVEHFHFWTKHIYGASALMPNMFVEISEELAKELGVNFGDKVKVSTPRGSIEAYALPTKRIKPLKVAGKTVHTVGIPIHWGNEGIVKGAITNLISPYVWDPNSQTPEFKGFLCKVEKA